MKKVIAIDIGGTKLTGAYVTSSRQPTNQITISVADISYSKAMDKLIELISALKKKHPQAQAVGLSIAGHIDKEGWIIQKHKKKWAKYHLQPRLEEIDLPVYWDNDGICALLSEWKMGAGINCKDLVVLTLGTKLGAGVVINNQILRLASGSSPRIGGILATPAGIDSDIYLGELASGYGLGESAKSKSTFTSINNQELAKLAEAGDKEAAKLFDECGHWLGVTIVNAMHLFDPQKVVITGGFSNTSHLLLKPAEKVIKKHLLPGTPSKVVLGKFLGNSGLMGAACLPNEPTARKS